MAFFYLLLGHLIGDFVLQTDIIAQNKGRHWKWNLIHAVVVTLFTFIMAYPFGVLLLALMALNGIAHFYVDYYKARLSAKLKLTNLAGFLLDQLIHIFLLFLISLSAVYTKPHILDIATVDYLLVIAFITSFSAVFTQFVLSSLFSRKGSSFFEKGEKQIGMLSRVYMAVVFYLSFVVSPLYLLLLLVAAAAFLLQFRRGWDQWMSLPHLAVKLLLDAMISIGSVLLVVIVCNATGCTGTVLLLPFNGLFP